MTWFMIDDGIYDSPQCEELPLSAIGLWAMAGSYVGRQLRHGDYDGAITMQRVRKLGGSPKLARQLVDAGLWRGHDAVFFDSYLQDAVRDRLARALPALAAPNAWLYDERPGWDGGLSEAVARRLIAYYASGGRQRYVVYCERAEH